MTEQTKPAPPALKNTSTQNITTPKKHSVGVAGLHARLRNPVGSQVDPLKCANRIVFTLDVSGSMSGEKITALRDACTGFVNTCDYNTTSIGIEPFGDDYPSPNRLGLTTLHPILLTTIQMLRDEGSTPMSRALSFVLNTYPVTRVILVSDGEPDDATYGYRDTYEEASNYKQAGIPIDCVHIGTSQSGEACLRHIAETTGGQYIKFTDINSFSRSFKYLAPAYYAQLTSGSITAEQLGAKELK